MNNRKTCTTQEKVISDKLKIPGFNDTANVDIKHRRKLEKIWQKDITNMDKYLEFYHQWIKVYSILYKPEKDFYHTNLNENKCNYKQIFSICNSLLGRNQDLPLSPSESNQDLTNDFKNFFIEKIKQIRINLKSQVPTIDNSEENYGILDVPGLPPSKLIHNFTPVDYKDVHKASKSSPSKSCKLDPIPTDLLKGMIIELVPLIAAVGIDH